MKTILGIGLAVTLGASLALADREIERSVDATADGTVSIEVLAGTLEIVGWDRNQVQVSGTLGDDIEDLDLSASGREVSIEIEIDDEYDTDTGGHERGRKRTRTISQADVHLVIRIPSGSSLELEAISADVEVRDVTGRIEIESVSGRTRITGDVISAEIENVSGTIEAVARRMFRSGEFSSVSGNVELDGAFDPKGRFEVSSVSGNVTMTVPADQAADFEIETFSGTISNDFGRQASKSDVLPSQSLEFSCGGGGARVSVESFSGRVAIKHK